MRQTKVLLSPGLLGAAAALFIVTGERAVLAQTTSGGSTSEAGLVLTGDSATATTRPAGDRGRDHTTEKEALVLQALDQPTDFSIQNAPILDAFDKLSSTTGIPIEFEPGAISLLPYNYRTELTAKVNGQPLRDVLEALLGPLGLHYEIRGGSVVIRPVAALKRVGRRATWEELALLERLRSQPWSEELAKSLEFQFVDAPSTHQDVSRKTLMKLTSQVGAGSAADVLEHATDRYGWTWFPEDKHIVVLPKTRQIERMLERRASPRFERANLKDVLMELARRADVLIQIEPGALASVPPQVSRFSFSVENATIRQILEIIAGETGLSYFIEPEGIRVTAAPGAAAATQPASTTLQVTNPIVGQISLPQSDGTSISLFVRENDLPPEVREMLRTRVKQATEEIRRSLQQPAKQPD